MKGRGSGVLVGRKLWKKKGRKCLGKCVGGLGFVEGKVRRMGRR